LPCCGWVPADAVLSEVTRGDDCDGDTGYDSRIRWHAALIDQCAWRAGAGNGGAEEVERTMRERGNKGKRDFFNFGDCFTITINCVEEGLEKYLNDNF